MCNTCSKDPRDAITDAERALFGLQLIISELPGDADIPSCGLAPLLTLIHDRLYPAVMQLDGYVPRNWTPPPA